MSGNSSPDNNRPVLPSASEILRGLAGAFLGIGSVAFVEQYFLNDADMLLVIGAFGATAVLIYGTPSSPLAQPYNVIVGHLISAAIGVSIFQLLGQADWLAAALAVSLAIVAMQLTRSVHPPGGASALIAVIASSEIHDLGYLYVIYPVGSGVILMLCVAFLTNNFLSEKKWPEFRQ